MEEYYMDEEELCPYCGSEFRLYDEDDFPVEMIDDANKQICPDCSYEEEVIKQGYIKEDFPVESEQDE